MITAQDDVSFSNSIVEAVNKILKSRYIRPKAPPDGTALAKVVAWAVNDYNAIRPYTSLEGLTPEACPELAEWEAYSSIRAETLRIPQKVESARIARIQANKQNACKVGC